MTVNWHSALCQVFLAWLLCIKVFFAWSVSFFCSETSSRTGLTNCGATLIAEDHPVPILTQHVNCGQLQSCKEYDSPLQQNRHHDHHCCRLNPLAPTAHNRGSGSLVPGRAARLPGIPELRTRPGPSSANNSSAAAKKEPEIIFRKSILFSVLWDFKRFGVSWILQSEWTRIFLIRRKSFWFLI